MIKSASKSKLTLWVSKDIKEFGQRWSREHKDSLSRLFTDFIRQLRNKKTSSSPIHPAVKELSGILKGSKVSPKDYKKHLEKKYL